MADKEIIAKFKLENMDEAIEKANQLKTLLVEVKELIDSLFQKEVKK